MKITKKTIKTVLVIIAVIVAILVIFSRPIAKSAVRSDNVAFFEILRKVHLVNPSAVWTEGRFLDVWTRGSYLSLAIESDSKNMFERLLSPGVLSEENSNHNDIIDGALAQATYSTDFYWIEGLAKAGIDLNKGWIRYRTDNIEMLEFYLNHGVNIDELSPVRGTSAALDAASENKFNVANYLINRGASVWVADTSGNTIGYYAESAPARGQMVEDGQGNSESKPWDMNSQVEKDRQKVLAKLRTLGFPSPAPEPEEVVKLVEAGKWPPKQ